MLGVNQGKTSYTVWYREIVICEEGLVSLDRFYICDEKQVVELRNNKRRAATNASQTNQREM